MLKEHKTSEIFIYRTRICLNSLKKEKIRVEKIFGASIEDVWSETKAYWEKRDPRILSKALKDGKLQMSLIFRWYLGLSSRWARQGDASYEKKTFRFGVALQWGHLITGCVEQVWKNPENRFAVIIAHTILKQVMDRMTNLFHSLTSMKMIARSSQ